jgi:protoporphyrinogen oxidase
LVTNDDGSVYKYENLISTIAIPDFLAMIQDCPEEYILETKELDYLSMKLGLVVVNHPIDTDIQRFYCAEETISAHKIALNHNSSDYLRNLPTHGIMMEISEGPEKTLYRQDMKQWIADDLKKVGAIKSHDEIGHIEVRNVKYSYPVPTKTRKAQIMKVKSFLEENDIYTLGRFGEWLYINSDKALKRGLDLGDQLASK